VTLFLKCKIYGDVPKTSDRIPGVLLVGEKGSKTTLLVEYMSIAAAKSNGTPTLVVNQPWHGDEFNLFIQSISLLVIIFLTSSKRCIYNDNKENSPGADVNSL
jgi:hypothetical protein